MCGLRRRRREAIERFTAWLLGEDITYVDDDDANSEKGEAEEFLRLDPFFALARLITEFGHMTRENFSDEQKRSLWHPPGKFGSIYAISDSHEYGYWIQSRKSRIRFELLVVSTTIPRETEMEVPRHA